MYPATKDATLKDAKNSASNIRDEAVSTAYGIQEDVHNAANHVGRRVRGFFDSASDEMHHMTDSVSQQVRSNPVQSTMIALGAGFVLGILFRR